MSGAGECRDQHDSHLDDRVLDARDMQAEIEEARGVAELTDLGKPSTFITAEQARAIVKPLTSYDVFRTIQHQAEHGETDARFEWKRLAPETMQLLGAGGYRVKRSGIDGKLAVISWADETQRTD